MRPESRAAVVQDLANGSHAHESTRARRLNFSLRTLLVAPILVGALLLCVFPKLVTGDYANVTITNVGVRGGHLRIEMATTLSADTSIGATVPAGGVFGSLVFGGGCEGWIPTWPKQGRTVIRLSPRAGAAQPADGDLESLLAVKVGETYCVTPGTPLKLEVTQEGFERRDQCTMHVGRGSRLGIKR